MKSSDEMITDLYERRDRYVADKKKKQLVWRRFAVSLIAVCLVALIGIGIWKSGVLRKDPVTPAGKTGETGKNEVTDITPTSLPFQLENAKELTANSTSGAPVNKKAMDSAMSEAYEKFAYRLFTQLPEGKTRMVSPFSVYVALSMLANGAEGETLAQLDGLLGLTADERNAYLAAWIEDLTKGGEGETKFANADSLWIKNEFEQYVPKTFLDTCAQNYRAAVFSAPMDNSTVEGINAWAKAKTADMIDEIIEELDPYTVMVLMNAIALDAKWVDSFDEAETQKDYTFTKADGTTVNVDMMHGVVDSKYLENDLATGFIKPYKGDEFSYIALLPKEGVSVGQLLESLQPGDIRNLCTDSRWASVKVGIPKYEVEYSLELSDTLKALGVTDAFEEDRADFSRLMELPHVFVDKVNHKTYISVDEAGAKAAAVTEVELQFKGVPQYDYVILDRPFVYMIVDSDGLPIFFGTFEG